MRWLLLLLMVPLAAGSINIEQHVAQTISNGAGPAILAVGDIGTPTIGASAHAATVSLSIVEVLGPGHILKLAGADGTWQVHAEWVSHSGWLVADEILLSLSVGALVEPQILVDVTGLGQASGTPVDLLETEVRVLGLGAGTLSFDLVLSPDVGGAELRYRVELTVS